MNTIETARQIMVAEAAKLGWSVGEWSIAQSQSSYTDLSHAERRQYGRVRIADHVALNRSLAGIYHIDVTLGATLEETIARIIAALRRFDDLGQAKVAAKASEAARIEARAKLIDDEMARRGLAHLTGEDRRKARNRIKQELKA